MTNTEGSDLCGTNSPHVRIDGASAFPHSSFIINSSFVIRRSDFVIFIGAICVILG